MNAVSLFSGAGGFELGLERAGIRTVLQAECDPWALAVLRRHWPDVEKVTDVRSVCSDTFGRSDAQVGAGSRLADRANRLRDNSNAQPGVDLIYGGFPCQDVSVAGKRAGLGGERSGLWAEFRRVLSELRPRWCLVENVPGLHSSAEGEDFTVVAAGLAELGYGVAWRIWDAQFFRVPQRRRRVFIVGLREPGGRAGAERAAQVLALSPCCGGHPAPRREAGEDVAYALAASVRGTGDGHGNAWNTTYVAEPARCVTARGNRFDGDADTLLVANSIQASAGHHGHSSPCGDGSDNLLAFDWTQGSGFSESAVPTLRVGTGIGLPSGPAVSTAFGVRRLTPLECERLMGWPDEHTRWTDDGREIPDSHRYRLCGNGVVATVAEWIGHRLVAVDALLKKESAA